MAANRNPHCVAAWLAAVCLVAAAVARDPSLKPAAPEPRSNPNGHDQTVKVERLVTGDAERIGDIVADTATLKFYFTPRPPLPGTEPSLAYPPGWSINGQTLTVSRGGFTSAWIAQIEGWDADFNGEPLLRAFQDKIDAAGFTGENASPPNPGCDLAYPLNQITCPKRCVLGPNEGNSCLQDTDCQDPNGPIAYCSDRCFACVKRCVGGREDGVPCVTLGVRCDGGACVDPCPTKFGEPGSKCGINIPGQCDWGWQNTTRPDWVMASIAPSDQYPVANIVTPSGPIFAGATNPGTELFDAGLRYYTGTLLLPVPSCAKGTYTIGHLLDGPSISGTFALDQAQPANNIAIAELVSGQLECTLGSCCTDFTSPATASCMDGVTVDECNSLPSANLHIFRPDADCNTPCEVECVGDSDCDDGLFCNGAEACVDTHCIPGQPPCGPGDVCNEEFGICTMEPVPTVSQWGLFAVAILLLIAAKISFRRRLS